MKKYPTKKELNNMIRQEHQRLDSGEHEIGSRGYDNVCKRIALLEEMKKRKMYKVKKVS